MPSKLPLLELKQKQVYTDLQVETNKMFHALQEYFASDFIESNLISRWIFDIAPLEESLIKIMKEYEELIRAKTEEYIESNEKKLIKMVNNVIVRIPNQDLGV
jgi:serine phosphatase RsbU (regulator of sigma subunit)